MGFSNPLSHSLAYGPNVDTAIWVSPLTFPAFQAHVPMYKGSNPLYSTSTTSKTPHSFSLAPHRGYQRPLKSCLKQWQASNQGHQPAQKRTARFSPWVNAHCIVTGKPHQPTARTGDEWKHYLVHGRRPPPPSEIEPDLEPADDTPPEDRESTLEPAEEALLDERLELAAIQRLSLMAGSQPNKRFRRALKAANTADKAAKRAGRDC